MQPIRNVTEHFEGINIKILEMSSQYLTIVGEHWLKFIKQYHIFSMYD